MDGGDARRQEAPALGAEGRRRAGIDHDVAFAVDAPKDPALAAFQAVGAGGKEGAAFVTRGGGHQGIGGVAVRDDDVHARLGSDLGGAQLRHHAARARPARATGGCFDLGVDTLDPPDQLRLAVRARVGIVEAIDVSQHHEQVGVDQVGDVGREAVVFANAGGQHRIQGDSIVFVDDRHRPRFEQVSERIPCVQIAEAVRKVAAGEEDLGDDRVVPIEQFVPALHQVALADAGDRLAGEDVAAGEASAQAVAAGGLRAAGDHRHLASLGAQTDHLANEPGHGFEVQAVGAGGEQAGAKLRDDAAVAHGGSLRVLSAEC